MMKSLAKPGMVCVPICVWRGVRVVFPRANQRQKQPSPRYLTHMRYRIETTFDQLVQWFHAK